MRYSESTIPAGFAHFNHCGKMYRSVHMATAPTKRALNVDNLAPSQGKSRLLCLSAERTPFRFIPAEIIFPNDRIVTVEEENEIELETFSAPIDLGESCWPLSVMQIMDEITRPVPSSQNMGMVPIDAQNKGISVAFTLDLPDLYFPSNTIKQVTLLVGRKISSEPVQHSAAKLIFSSFSTSDLGDSINTYLQYLAGQASMGAESLRLARSSIPPEMI